MSERFRAILLEEEAEEGGRPRTTARVAELPVSDLPEGDVLLEVACSTLNYKDALAITGAGKIVRRFPFVPGIDLAGRVLASSDPRFKLGDEAVLTGWGVGERHWGGLATRARVRADWLVPKPEGLTLEETMAVGTAGFTAMLCVMALEQQEVPADGVSEVVVTGAAGGVGSIALPLLARAGFRAVAVSGRKEELGSYLKELGAAEVVGREVLLDADSKAPLGSGRWTGAIDTAGGAVLAGLLKTMRNGGTVAACGLAAGPKLETTVFPFILRGVRLIGVDSVLHPAEHRPAVWARLARDLDRGMLARLSRTVSLDEAIGLAPAFLEGKVQGRIVVRSA